MNDMELFQMNSSDGFYSEIRDSVINECTKKIVDFHHEVEAEREVSTIHFGYLVNVSNRNI